MIKPEKYIQIKNYRGSIWKNPKGRVIQITKYYKLNNKQKLHGIEFFPSEASIIEVLIQELRRYDILHPLKLNLLKDKKNGKL